MTNAQLKYPHDVDPEIFREALSYSEADKGFTSTLIEKDYYCSLILQYFFNNETLLVFKGGTCLSKVYVDFYRLSEDLDLIIPVTADTTRTQRSANMEPVKSMFEKLPSAVPGVTISDAFKGHNASRQYISSLEYHSVIVEKKEKIKIEVGIREPLLRPSESRLASTIVMNPFSGHPLLPPFKVGAMTLQEAYAEKIRAAITRKDPAIRDFFDVFYAIRKRGLNTQGPDFLSMVKAKIDVPGNEPIDLSEERKQELNRQLEGQLKPVLRPSDFDGFNLNEAFELVRNITEALSL
jgi:predicted nucleotidyltransferase component of viral defense system